MSTAREKADGIMDARLAKNDRPINAFWRYDPNEVARRNAIEAALLSEREAGRAAGMLEAAEVVGRFGPHAEIQTTIRTQAAAIRTLALTPREEEAGWRKIETAPKDGASFFAYESNGPYADYYECWWHEDFGWMTGHSSAEPTHWQPLSKPPNPPLPASINEMETK